MTWLFDHLTQITIATLIAVPVLIIAGCVWLAHGLKEIEKETMEGPWK